MNEIPPTSAELAWEAYATEVGHRAEDNPMRYSLVYRAFLAGFEAATK